MNQYLHSDRDLKLGNLSLSTATPFHYYSNESLYSEGDLARPAASLSAAPVFILPAPAECHTRRLLNLQIIFVPCFEIVFNKKQGSNYTIKRKSDRRTAVVPDVLSATNHTERLTTENPKELYRASATCI